MGEDLRHAVPNCGVSLAEWTLAERLRRRPGWTGVFFGRWHSPPDVTESVSTGCDALDDLLDGGFERGTVTQVYGPPRPARRTSPSRR